MKARAKAILFQYGNLHYPQQDIDQRDLREAVVGEERGLLGSKHMSEITRRNWIKSY